MVAHNFQKRFEPSIRAGTKRHTIRAERAGRSRHARPGELVQLYVGLRTRFCRLIADPLCERVEPVRINFDTSVVSVDAAWFRTGAELDAFAVSDGFEDWSDFVAFWGQQHPGVVVFFGSMISWHPIAPDDLRPAHSAGGGGRQMDMFPQVSP